MTVRGPHREPLPAGGETESGAERRRGEGLLNRRKLLSACASLTLLGRNAMAAPAMISRPIPTTGEAMPVIGLGTWQVFDVGTDPDVRAPLREVLRRLTDGG